MQPAFDLAGLPEQVDLRLAQLVAGIDQAKKFLTLREAGVLFILGRKQGPLGGGGGGIQLGSDDVKLLLRELLIEFGDLGLGVQDSEAVAKLELAEHGGLLRVFGLGAGMIGVSQRLACLGLVFPVEEGKLDLHGERAFVRADLGVIDALQLFERVGEGGVAVVLDDER